MDVQRSRIAIFAALCGVFGACATGLQDPGPKDNGEEEWTSAGPGSSSGNGGAGGASGNGGAGGQGANGGAGVSSSSGNSSSSVSSSSNASSASSSSSSSAASSSSGSSSSSSSSSGSSSGGGPCPGTVVDWNWNVGTAPTNLMYSGMTWAIGAATKGPADNQTYLATSPSSGAYPAVANAWAMLPAIDLSAYGACQLRVTVEVWRDAEQYGLNYYDGGNLQYTTDASGANGWTWVSGASMNYEAYLTDCVGSCLVVNQQTWTGSASPKWKTGIWEATTPPGSSLRLRFTFCSDVGNELGPLPGLYVRRVHVEAF